MSENNTAEVLWDRPLTTKELGYCAGAKQLLLAAGEPDLAEVAGGAKTIQDLGTLGGDIVKEKEEQDYLTLKSVFLMEASMAIRRVLMDAAEDLVAKSLPKSS